MKNYSDIILLNLLFPKRPLVFQNLILDVITFLSFKNNNNSQVRDWSDWPSWNTLFIFYQNILVHLLYLAIPILLLIHPSPALDNDLLENLPEPILLPVNIVEIIKKKNLKIINLKLDKVQIISDTVLVKERRYKQRQWIQKYIN